MKPPTTRLSLSLETIKSLDHLEDVTGGRKRHKRTTMGATEMSTCTQHTPPLSR